MTIVLGYRKVSRYSHRLPSTDWIWSPWQSWVRCATTSFKSELPNLITTPPRPFLPLHTLYRQPRRIREAFKCTARLLDCFWRTFLGQVTSESRYTPWNYLRIQGADGACKSSVAFLWSSLNPDRRLEFMPWNLRGWDLILQLASTILSWTSSTSLTLRRLSHRHTSARSKQHWNTSNGVRSRMD